MMLAEPTTARRAALQLEAIGKDGVPGLREGLTSPHPEVRFYSAYSLAYLDDSTCATELSNLARQFPEFRYLSLDRAWDSQQLRSSRFPRFTPSRSRTGSSIRCSRCYHQQATSSFRFRKRITAREYEDSGSSQ